MGYYGSSAKKRVEGIRRGSMGVFKVPNDRAWTKEASRCGMELVLIEIQ